MKNFVESLLKKSNIEFAEVIINRECVNIRKINNTELHYITNYHTGYGNSFKISREENLSLYIEANVKEEELVEISEKIMEYYENNESLLTKKNKRFEYFKK